MEQQLFAMLETKNALLGTQHDLKEQIENEEATAVELELMDRLGVVPRGQIKVYFK